MSKQEKAVVEEKPSISDARLQAAIQAAAQRLIKEQEEGAEVAKIADASRRDYIERKMRRAALHKKGRLFVDPSILDPKKHYRIVSLEQVEFEHYQELGYEMVLDESGKPRKFLLDRYTKQEGALMCVPKIDYEISLELERDKTLARRDAIDSSARQFAKAASKTFGQSISAGVSVGGPEPLN